jgi:hypothetical protein
MARIGKHGILTVRLYRPNKFRWLPKFYRGGLHSPLAIYWLGIAVHYWISPSWLVQNCPRCRAQFEANEGLRPGSYEITSSGNLKRI